MGVSLGDVLNSYSCFSISVKFSFDPVNANDVTPPIIPPLCSANAPITADLSGSELFKILILFSYKCSYYSFKLTRLI